MTPDQMIDTASHASKEAMRVMLEVIERNCRILGGTSDKDRGMTSLIAMSLLSSKFDVVFDHAPVDRETIDGLIGDLAADFRKEIAA